MINKTNYYLRAYFMIRICVQDQFSSHVERFERGGFEFESVGTWEVKL
jgi:hypothetical protein